jgi:hypothetical protein
LHAAAELLHHRIDGVVLNRSTGTDDKKLAEQLARKWEHDAVQTIKYQGERPVTVHDAIKAFLDERKHMKGYDSALTHMNRWKAALPDVLMKSLRKQQVQAVIQKRIAQGIAHNSIAVFVIYWNALINYCERNKLSAGPKADRVQAKPTRFRVISLEEEAAILAATCPHAKYPGKNPLNDSRRQETRVYQRNVLRSLGSSVFSQAALLRRVAARVPLLLRLDAVRRGGL